MDKSSVTRPWNASSLLIVGLGSGILAGLIEGVGLLFFQRLNWARWGPMIHVSGEIVWISPIVDVTLFSVSGADLQRSGSFLASPSRSSSAGLSC